MKYIPRIVLASALFILPAAVNAQPYSLQRSTVAGGGASGTGGTFSLNGTAGQPFGGLSAGGSSSVTAGFWATEAVQTPPGVKLSLVHFGAHLTLSWPTNWSGLVLQQTTDIGKPNWTAVSQPVVVSNNQYTVTVPAMLPKQFFRLVHP